MEFKIGLSEQPGCNLPVYDYAFSDLLIHSQYGDVHMFRSVEDIGYTLRFVITRENCFIQNIALCNTFNKQSSSQSYIKES